MKTIRDYKEESKLIEIPYFNNDFCTNTLYDISDNNVINKDGCCVFSVGDAIAEYINKKQRITDRYFEGSDVIGAACFDKNDHRLDVEYDELSEIAISASHKSVYYAGYRVGFQSAIDLILRHSEIDESFLEKSFMKKCGLNKECLSLEGVDMNIYELVEGVGIELD